MVAIQWAFGNLADLAYHLVLSHHSHCLQGPHAGKGKIAGDCFASSFLQALLNNHEKRGPSVRVGTSSRGTCIRSALYNSRCLVFFLLWLLCRLELPGVYRGRDASLSVPGHAGK